MADGNTAADQLARILYLLPAASERSLSVEAAADLLGVSPETILDDIAMVTAREYYHPAGGAESLRVEVEGGTIRVESHGRFDRPVRLNAWESVAVHVALRHLAAGAEEATRRRVLEIAARLASDLASAVPDEFVERVAVEETGDPGGVLAALRRAAAGRRRCRIVYVRSGGDAASERSLDPYSVVDSHGTLFTVGYCGLRDDVRAFRVDRIIDITVTDETFEVPDDYALEDWIEDGRVFKADAVETVVVRYTGAAAARMPELGPVEADGEGVRVKYEVADPHWLVRHVLQQGGDAEVVEPARVRRAVARAAARLSAGERPPG